LKIRGKNPTVAQRKALMASGLSDDEVDLYLINSIKHVEEGSRRPTKYGTKEELWILTHRETGEMREVVIS